MLSILLVYIFIYIYIYTSLPAMAHQLGIQGGFGYRSVQLIKSEANCLGIGSYGAVYKAKCVYISVRQFWPPGGPALRANVAGQITRASTLYVFIHVYICIRLYIHGQS